jgi:hypothetical protein
LALARALSVALALALAGPGCATAARDTRSRAPSRAPKRLLAQIPVHGHVVKVWIEGANGRMVGELIAASRDGLWIRTGDAAVREAVGPKRVLGTAKAERHAFVPTERIRRVVVHRYRVAGAMGGVAGWGAGAILLTMSHGWWFVVSMPLTAVATGGALAGTYVQSLRIVGKTERNAATFPTRLADLRQFSRFPAGPPPGWPDAVGAAEPSHAVPDPAP